jgi:hypothetical protein
VFDLLRACLNLSANLQIFALERASQLRHLSLVSCTVPRECSGVLVD